MGIALQERELVGLDARRRRGIDGYFLILEKRRPTAPTPRRHEHTVDEDDHEGVLSAVKGMTLREFCRLANLDPSNWSKVERGILPPPKSSRVMSDIAGVLLIEKESDEWNELFDLAAIGHIPAQLLSGPAVSDNLTIYFRAARGENAPTPKQFKTMINALKATESEGKTDAAKKTAVGGHKISRQNKFDQIVIPAK